LTELGQYENAERFSLDGYKGLLAAAGDPPVTSSWPIRCMMSLHAAPGAPPLRIRQALDRIVTLYESWNKPEQAASWQAKRAELERKLGIGGQP
jgi:hypothetical protein